nr:EOG090X07YB [Cyclestheria hislopi]
MNQQYHNPYHEISCEDGTSVGFHKETDFLLLAVTQLSVSATHLVKLSFELLQHICGPSLSLFKFSKAHSEMATLLLEKYFHLRHSKQSVLTETLHYLKIPEDSNLTILNTLKQSSNFLQSNSNISSSRLHILILQDSSIVGIYSGKGSSELGSNDIFFLILVAEAFSTSQLSINNYIIILESCVPYTIHLKKLKNGQCILILVETKLRKIALNFQQVLKMIKNPEDSVALRQEIKTLQKMAIKLNHEKWSETIVWRENITSNEAAMSALCRRLLTGFEKICLDPALLFVATNPLLSVIEHVETQMMNLSILLPSEHCSLLQSYPGLVHFVLVDRKNHRLIGPNLPPLHRDSSLDSVWEMFQTSLEWLHEGRSELLWNDKHFVYSHFLWVEDSNGKKIPWKSTWNTQMGLLGYPGIVGTSFYKKLLQLADSDMSEENLHYFQLFCVHLELTSSATVLEQCQQLTQHLKGQFFQTSIFEGLL